MAHHRGHIHIAGVPCVFHSKFGKKESLKNFAGSMVFYAWCRHRVEVLEPVVVLENVEEFGDEELKLCLDQ